MHSSETFLNGFEAAQYLRISFSALDRLTAHRNLPHYRDGRCIRYRASELDEWAREQALREERRELDGPENDANQIGSNDWTFAVIDGILYLKMAPFRTVWQSAQPISIADIDI